MAKDKKEIEFSTGENFQDLLTEYFETTNNLQGSVVSGTIVSLDNDYATVDVGLKSEGRISLKEFGLQAELNLGDKVDVYIDRYEDREGNVVLSRDKARREESWNDLEKMQEKGEHVVGTIFGKVKGGFTVDLNGAVAFLPGSQVDVRPIRDISALMGVPQPFVIIKMDRVRGNIVVSRRAILEETRAEQRSEIMSNLSEGQVVEGIVKNITDYGAFIDLGGVDGLLHVTDISWRRISHPSEVLSVGQPIKVQIIKFNNDNQRISLGMKQLEEDPWKNIEGAYKVGDTLQGIITNITDYGAFVEIQNGIEGLVHVSEMSWTKKNIHPSKLVSTSQNVNVVVLEVEPEKRRISLGIKQSTPNPWQGFANSYNSGDEIEGEVRNITEFGLFVSLPGEIDGMIHLSDLSWEKSGDEALKDYSKGMIIKAKILDIDVEKERVSLGVKQLQRDDFAEATGDIKKGSVVTCTVSSIEETGIEVDVDGLTGYIKKSDLSRDKSEQNPSRFAVGDRVDAKITQIDSKTRKISLSIKAREIEEEKQAMAEFGSTDSGASLGDILGAALAKKENK